MNYSSAPDETEGPSPAWRSFRLIAIIAGLALLALLVGRTCFNTQGRVLVKARAPNGVEVYLVQRFDGGYYNISFFCRRPDGVWGWGYIEHEDGFWPASRATVQLNTNDHRVVVLRDGKPLLHYDWVEDAYLSEDRRNDVRKGAELWDLARPTPNWWSPDLLPSK